MNCIVLKNDCLCFKFFEVNYPILFPYSSRSSLYYFHKEACPGQLGLCSYYVQGSDLKPHAGSC